jgi:hypothetical protein
MKKLSKENLQRVGGASALVSAASYVFALGLLMAMMTPLTDSNLGFNEYMTFLIAHQRLNFIWNFLLYIVHGAALMILVLAYYERLKDDSPILALIGTGFGFIWTGFVLLSGFICLSGTEALITLYAKQPEQAEVLKILLNNLTFGIDISDRYLGSLWVGLISLAAWKNRRFPRIANIIGLALSGSALVVGLIAPINNVTGSLIFGMGVLIWWIITGICMLRKFTEE